MEDTRDRSYEPEPDGTRRREVIEMHLFDDDAAEEKALCGADTSDDNRRSAMYYLEDRLHGAWVGTVCEGCKERAAPFALNLAQDLEDEGLPDEAAEYRELAETISGESGPTGRCDEEG